MNFSEAMIELHNDKRVTRQSWTDKIYLSMTGNYEGEVRAYRSSLRHYSYDSSIFVCPGWFILGEEIEYLFYQIVDKLYAGQKAQLKEWGEAYIYYDNEMKNLVYHSMQEFCFSPEFKDLLADDWVVVE